MHMLMVYTFGSRACQQKIFRISLFAGASRPKQQEWEAELAKELAMKRSQQRNMAISRA